MLPKHSRWLVKAKLLLDQCAQLTHAVFDAASVINIHEQERKKLAAEGEASNGMEREASS